MALVVPMPTMQVAWLPLLTVLLLLPRCRAHTNTLSFAGYQALDKTSQIGKTIELPMRFRERHLQELPLNQAKRTCAKQTKPKQIKKEKLRSGYRMKCSFTSLSTSCCNSLQVCSAVSGNSRASVPIASEAGVVSFPVR